MIILIAKMQKIEQNLKCTLDRVNILNGCSTTIVPLTEASSNEPIFYTMVQKGLKPHEASFGHHCTAVIRSSAEQKTTL